MIPRFVFSLRVEEGRGDFFFEISGLLGSSSFHAFLPIHRADVFSRCLGVTKILFIAPLELATNLQVLYMVRTESILSYSNKVFCF